MGHANTLLRDATAKARKVALLKTMITDFETMAASLAREIAAEEERTRIKDTKHVAYSTWATAVALRRSNLLVSAADLQSKLDVAQRELDEVTARMRALELAETPARSISTIAIATVLGSERRPVTAGPPAEFTSVEAHQISLPQESSLPAD